MMLLKMCLIIKDLYEYIFDIVFNGEEKDFNIDNNIVDLEELPLGILKKKMER